MAEVTTISQGLNRRWATRELLRARGDCLVISGLGSPTYDVYAAGDCDANMYLWGAMGGAAMIGLGLALAQPSRQVVVVTGDGEQLMGLGSLATFKVAHAANLTIVVLDNGYYLETGGQKSHTSLGVELAKVGRAVGLDVVDIRTEEELRDFACRLTEEKASPRLVRLKIATETVDGVLPPRDGIFLKQRFRANLGLQAN
jgi:thiamine pyrophosphate-dependent acetolactate synthase large subunit-like protein